MDRWIYLESPPLCIGSNMQMIDANNFIVAGSDRNSDGIYKYNIINNKWELLTQLERRNGFSYKPWSIAYNKLNNKIFVNKHINVSSRVMKSAKMMIYNCTRKQFEPIQYKTGIEGEPYIIDIDGTIHIIGGENNNLHFVWDDNEQSLQKLYEFDEWSKGNSGGHLIYIKSRQILLLLGGEVYTENHDADDTSTTIWSHSIGSNQWSKLDIHIPVKFSSLCCILSSEEKYIITFGGVEYNDIDPYEHFRDWIWILNLETMKWRKSKVTCPDQHLFVATLYRNKIKDRLLVSGYIKNVFESGVIPMEIVASLSEWCLTDYVFLLGLTHSEKGHWKIRIDEILQ
eukprot:322606_1